MYGCLLMAGALVAPPLIFGIRYRSPGLSIAMVAVAIGAAVLFTLLLIPFAFGSAPRSGPAAEGAGVAPFVWGPLLGWLTGMIVPVWMYRKYPPVPGRSRAAGHRGDPFDYTQYTLEELRDAADHIDRHAHADRARALDAEIASRVRPAVHSSQ